MNMNDDKCHNCQTTNTDDDIQQGLCAECFRELPEGDWHTAGTWGLAS
jgi:threonine synthase